MHLIKSKVVVVAFLVSCAIASIPIILVFSPVSEEQVIEIGGFYPPVEDPNSLWRWGSILILTNYTTRLENISAYFTYDPEVGIKPGDVNATISVNETLFEVELTRNDWHVVIPNQIIPASMTINVSVFCPYQGFASYFFKDLQIYLVEYVPDKFDPLVGIIPDGLVALGCLAVAIYFGIFTKGRKTKRLKSSQPNKAV